MSLLEATQVTKRFGGLTAVSQFDMEIPEESIASLIGPNGAGKTTFFNCVTGFYQIDEGTIVFDGQLLNGLSSDRITRKGISRTYQNIRLFANMTAIENVMVGEHPLLKTGIIGTLAWAPSEAEDEVAESRAREILEFVGMAGKGDAVAKNLPYGDQRRYRDVKGPIGDFAIMQSFLNYHKRFGRNSLRLPRRQAVNPGQLRIFPIRAHQVVHALNGLPRPLDSRLTNGFIRALNVNIG